MIPTKEDLILAVLKAPNKLYDSENSLLMLKKKIDDIKNNISSKKARMNAQVFEDSKKEEFAKSLSNSDKRDNEVRARLDMNENYKALCVELSILEEQHVADSILLKRDERLFQANKAVAYLMANG